MWSEDENLKIKQQTKSMLSMAKARLAATKNLCHHNLTHYHSVKTCLVPYQALINRKSASLFPK